MQMVELGFRDHNISSATHTINDLLLDNYYVSYVYTSACIYASVYFGHCTYFDFISILQIANSNSHWFVSCVEQGTLTLPEHLVPQHMYR